MNDADLAHRLQIAALPPAVAASPCARRPLVPENTVAGNALAVVIAIMSVPRLPDARRGRRSSATPRATGSPTSLREVTIQVRPVEGVDLDGRSGARRRPSLALTKGVAERRGARRQGERAPARAVARHRPRPRRAAHPAADRRPPRPTRSSSISPRCASRLKAQVPRRHARRPPQLDRRAATMANATVRRRPRRSWRWSSSRPCFSVVFATRGAMASNRDVVWCCISSAPRTVSSRASSSATSCCSVSRGGLAGAALAAVLFALLSFSSGRSMAPPDDRPGRRLFGRFAVGPVGYFGALGIAFLRRVDDGGDLALTVYRLSCRTADAKIAN